MGYHQRNTVRKVFVIAIRIYNLYIYRTAFKIDMFETVILHHNPLSFFVEIPKHVGLFLIFDKNTLNNILNSLTRKKHMF